MEEEETQEGVGSGGSEWWWSWVRRWGSGWLSDNLKETQNHPLYCKGRITSQWGWWVQRGAMVRRRETGDPSVCRFRAMLNVFDLI